MILHHRGHLAEDSAGLKSIVGARLDFATALAFRSAQVAECERRRELGLSDSSPSTVPRCALAGAVCLRIDGLEKLPLPRAHPQFGEGGLARCDRKILEETQSRGRRGRDPEHPMDCPGWSKCAFREWFGVDAAQAHATLHLP